MIHVASPFKAKTDPEFFMNPAVEGTNSVLQGCLDSGIKKLIVTSSIAAIRGFEGGINDFDESHWADPDHQFTNAYAASKTLAEKAIWEFHNNLPADSNLEIVSMNPAFIVGKKYFFHRILLHFYGINLKDYLSNFTEMSLFLDFYHTS